MKTYGAGHGRVSMWRRWLALPLTAMLAAGLVVGVAAPSDAAATHGAIHATKATKWYWVALVKIPVSSTTGSTVAAAAVHPQKHLVVKGKKYSSLLAGNVPAGGTGAATFNLGKHCKEFRSTIGLTDSSPSTASIAYSVYFGDIAEAAPPDVKHGKTRTIDLKMSKVSKLILRNTEPDPGNAFAGTAVAAWPNAQVLCNVKF